MKANELLVALSAALAAGMAMAATTGDYDVLFGSQKLTLQEARISAVPYNRVWTGVQRPLDQTKMANFVSFDLEAPGEFTVRPGQTVPFRVLPLSLQRPSVAEDGALTFRIERPCKFVVDFGDALPPLHVFADPPFAYKHVPGELYFGPGEHFAGIIAPTNGQTVCLDRGAVVHAEMFLNRVTNVVVTGRGILDTSTFKRSDPRAVAYRRSQGLPDADTEFATHSFTVRGSKNVLIEGITLRDTPFWSLVVRGGCEEITIDNVKVIGQWRYNSDGIDIEASENVVVKNCFVRSFDDCGVVIGPYIEDSGHRTHNVRFLNNDFWCDWGANIKVWTAHLPADVSKIRFSGNRLLNVSGRMAKVGDEFGSSDTWIRDVVIEDMEVDVAGPRAKEVFHAVEDAPYPGGVQPVLEVASVHACWPRENLGNQHGRPVKDPSVYKCRISDVTFRNFSFPGERPPLIREVRAEAPGQVIESVTFDETLPFAANAADAVGNVGDIRLKGYLGARLEAMITQHVGGTDVDYVTACFLEKTETKGWWQTEFWGKYMHSAVPYAVYSGSPKIAADVERGIARMLASQEPDGYIGNYPDELRCGEGWDVWGMKYTMMGLLHYYDGCRSGKVKAWKRGDDALQACRRLCDYVMGEIGPGGKRGRELWQTGNWSGYASSSILEPVVWLYRRTRDQKYLDFASYIVKGMTEPKKGPRLIDLALEGISVADRNEADYKTGADWAYVCKYGRSKAYEMMSCYQGLMDYVEMAGAKGMTPELEKIVKAAVMTGEDIVKEEINLAGGCACSEAWFHGARKQHLPYLRLQETCVTTTWMRFCEKLLEVTGDPKWADQIERTFYNAYLGAMKADGAEFAGYTPLSGNRYHGQHHCFMHTDCCTANGPRGFLCFLKELFRTGDDGVCFNFYTTALVAGTLPKTGAKVAFDMYALYPRNGYARIVSHTDATAGEVLMKLRIPGWCGKATVKLNGQELPDVRPGAYFTVSRTWKLGDIVEVSFDMPVVAHALDHHIAFTRGPVLLARDSRFDDGDMSEPLRNGIGDCRYIGLKDGQTMSTFAEVRTPSDAMWMAFSATLPLGSHHENPEAAKPSTVFFCDYASAGNAWRPGNYYRTWFPVEYGPGE